MSCNIVWQCSEVKCNAMSEVGKIGRGRTEKRRRRNKTEKGDISCRINESKGRTKFDDKCMYVA